MSPLLPFPVLIAKEETIIPKLRLKTVNQKKAFLWSGTEQKDLAESGTQSYLKQYCSASKKLLFTKWITAAYFYPLTVS